jgi:hypothetical protein
MKISNPGQIGINTIIIILNINFSAGIVMNVSEKKD